MLVSPQIKKVIIPIEDVQNLGPVFLNLPGIIDMEEDTPVVSIYFYCNLQHFDLQTFYGWKESPDLKDKSIDIRRIGKRGWCVSSRNVLNHASCIVWCTVPAKIYTCNSHPPPPPPLCTNLHSTTTCTFLTQDCHSSLEFESAWSVAVAIGFICIMPEMHQ